MSRRMSCSMTIDAVRERRKTVTRRHVNTWRTLQPGDRLTLVEKGMGLAKGERQVVLAEVEIVSVRVEPIGLALRAGEVAAEGFGSWEPAAFVRFWLDSHGYGRLDGESWDVQCRRIEWRYIDEAAP